MAASLHSELPGMTAWTGGTPPRPLSQIGRLERALCRREFRRQLLEYRSCWGGLPERHLARLFWNRARHDAHATCRNADRLLAQARPDLRRRGQ
ncbi:hypothetical protein [Microvirga sp. VF16]|uniref:hypothetical protein n=1 Tax=Microvirga sp. VF16 TaxID=2807101 RepID=UPI00193E2AB1|nr:hypothetical protein [Microvirga sp. VF16]QRM32684.1 hypothetical protein JO965_31920 [Microvirga sp. VF16]